MTTKSTEDEWARILRAPFVHARSRLTSRPSTRTNGSSCLRTTGPHGAPAYLPGDLEALNRAIDLADPATDWAEIAELVYASYRMVAPRRLIAELDGRCSR
ncbi:MAG TPA: hypothetical protein VFD59_08760 [Nocardioidaceae bacterium]|nr:hypothetical protein [Nocardioidaceae bacterium]